MIFSFVSWRFQNTTRWFHGKKLKLTRAQFAPTSSTSVSVLVSYYQVVPLPVFSVKSPRRKLNYSNPKCVKSKQLPKKNKDMKVNPNKDAHSSFSEDVHSNKQTKERKMWRIFFKFTVGTAILSVMRFSSIWILLPWLIYDGWPRLR